MHNDKCWRVAGGGGGFGCKCKKVPMPECFIAFN